MKYIKPTLVRRLAKEHGKGVTRGYLLALDAKVEETVKSSCRLHNGGRKRLTAALIEFSK